MALTLDESVATDFFGIPRTVDQVTAVPETKIVYRVVRRKVHGHWKRVKVRRKITEYVNTVTQVRNPVLDKMHAIQLQGHEALGAKYPWYKGDC